MKTHFSKLAEHMFFLVLAVFLISISFNTTSYAATQKVENVRQTDARANGVKVSWDKMLSGVEKYKMYLSENKAFPQNATSTATTTYYNGDTWIWGLNPNSTYYVKVTALTSSGVEFAVSDVITCVTQPDSIRNVKHTQSTTSSITMSWDAPFSGAAYYKVYYKPSNSSVKAIYAGSTTGRSFTITGLEDDTEYHTYIYAARKSENGYEATSTYNLNGYNSTIAKANKFSKIKLNKWEAGSSKATITFATDIDNQSGIELEISSLSGKKIKTIKDSQYANSITMSLSKIKNKGFKYRLRYYVTTDTQTCYGPYTKEKVVIAQPKVTASKKSNTSVKLKWKKISGATSYTIYMRKETGDNFKKVATVKSTSYVLKKTKPRTNYYIYVKANGVKSGKKKYSSTKPVNQSITEVWYSDNNSYISNYYKIVTE